MTSQLGPSDQPSSPHVGNLAGQVAVITGGASGIGLAVARELGGRGCRVVIASRNSQRVAEAVSSIPGSLGYPGCDVRSAASVEGLLAFAEAQAGPVEILVTSAGIARSPRSTHHVPQSVAQLDEPVWDDILDTNLRGVFLAARAAVSRMAPRRRGQIVNISSARAARKGLPYGAGYCASKRAALALLEALAAEVGPLGIRVFSFLPDVVETGMIAGTQLGKQGSLRAEEVATWLVDLLAEPSEVQVEAPALVPIRPRAWQRTAETPTQGEHSRDG